MPYTIRFENMAEATAPAQWIRITDTFDDDLDLTTFELTEFMLGGEIFAIPAGLDSYQAMFERTIEGNDLVIDVDIALDYATRTLSASFMALDPETGWMPEDPMVGLLYPNDDTGRGDGHLAYVVNTVAGLASGTADHQQGPDLLRLERPHRHAARTQHGRRRSAHRPDRAVRQHSPPGT